MRSDLEPVVAALFSALENDRTLSGIVKKFSRKDEFWDKLDKQPALFLRQTFVRDAWHDTILSVTEVELQIVIFMQFKETEVHSTSMNAMLAAVRDVFSPDDPQTNLYTIAGAVYWCRIDGETVIDTGEPTNQGRMIVPVKITLP